MPNRISKSTMPFCCPPWFFLFLTMVIAAWQPLLCHAQESMDEFNGPFTSWVNVKTMCGAKGDGKHDDTKAIQKALDSLSDHLSNFNTGSRAYSVVYFPAGTYKITATLVLRGKMGVKVVGADPQTTKMLWQGNDTDTVFWADGSSYFSLARFQWDAGGRKNMEAIGLHWKQKDNGTYAPTQIEFSDHIFNGFVRGIGGGTFGNGDGVGANESEIAITRCTFNGCTESGIVVKGFNALDYWVWNCRFIKCRIGVTSSSGNYHIYKSYFSESTLSDVYNINSYYTSVRYCYSTGAASFSRDDGSSTNPFKRIFEGNTVIGLKTTGIKYNHTGKITLLDNVFKAAPGNTSMFLEYASWAPSHFDLLELNNSYTGFLSLYQISSPSRIFKTPVALLRTAAVQTRTAAQFLANMPVTPPYHARTIIDVPLNSNTAQVQQLVDKAVALQQRAILHFSTGRYSLSAALTVPANSDIQITGDGYLYGSTLSRIYSTSFENGAVLKITCPTTVSIRDMDIDVSKNEKYNTRAIALINADQPGSTVILDQVYSNNDTTLLVKEYDYTLFQKTNSFFTDGNFIAGGKLVNAGGGTMKVQGFGAQFANTTLQRGASFIAKDCWWEGHNALPINLNGKGSFTLDGAMVSPYKKETDSSAAISVGAFSGKVCLMDMYIHGALDVQKNNPALQILGWNLNFDRKKKPLAFVAANASYQLFFSGITSQCNSNTDPDCGGQVKMHADAAVNTKDPDGFMETMTKDLRAAIPFEYVARPKGVSNFYVSRVAISENYKTGFAFIK